MAEEKLSEEMMAEARKIAGFAEHLESRVWYTSDWGSSSIDGQSVPDIKIDPEKGIAAYVLDHKRWRGRGIGHWAIVGAFKDGKFKETSEMLARHPDSGAYDRFDKWYSSVTELDLDGRVVRVKAKSCRVHPPREDTYEFQF